MTEAERLKAERDQTTDFVLSIFAWASHGVGVGLLLTLNPGAAVPCFLSGIFLQLSRLLAKNGGRV